jgi:hypothetical protein
MCFVHHCIYIWLYCPAGHPSASPSPNNQSYYLYERHQQCPLPLPGMQEQYVAN